MSNVKEVDIGELMRRNDAPLVELVDQWEQAYHAFVAAQAGKREGLATRIEEIEGQIARYTPTTFRGLGSILHMGHMILSARDANSDCYIADGPATILVARAIKATAYQDGMIDGKTT